ncbi:restriction endonuclease subunit S [Haemophilus aegyptius]|uniref:restriction endonuclease subunit S n=1 Tax=Haemophilus aegyptius TaxID=197575 RepID=UPI000802BB31|nr:restriction endonuclease subunit S [Haemophilus aegyptius]STO62613.1 type I site-specific restriction-modification system, S subunit [Haemophilus aegyptius]
MRRYESYKDSGVEWLGEVPHCWDVKKVKNIFHLIAEPAAKNNQCELLSVYTDIGVKPRAELEERGNKASTTDGYWIVKKGDIVVNKLLAWMGAIGLSEYDGVTSPAYDILRPYKKINGKFFHYLFRTPLCLSEFKKNSRGIMDMRLRLYFEELGNIYIPFPSYPEQQKIAQFLDDKTAKIDQAVDLAEKQIALLKEHKQILIQNAVTRGLNPDVPLKDSGVEWIGQVPEHWDVQRSKFIFKKIERKVNEEDQIVTCFRDGQVTLRANRRTEGFTNALKEHGYQGIRKGDLVIHAMDAFAGAIGISDSDGKATPVYSVCLPHDKQKIDVYFYAYYLRNLALSGFISSLAKGIRERSTDFRYSDFAELLLPIPPYLEQQKIADYLDTQTAKIDQAIALKTAHIEKLKEYKSVLINDVVTGKVQV